MSADAPCLFWQKQRVTGIDNTDKNTFDNDNEMAVQIAAGRTLTEVDVDDFLTGRRAAQGGFIEPSFPTIAGSGPNGAIIHYRAQPDTCNTVSGSQLLLVDSGERAI